MKRFLNFLDKLAENPKWNIFIIVMFLLFMISEAIVGNLFYMIIDILIITTESFNLKDNLKKKKALEENK